MYLPIYLFLQVDTPRNDQLRLVLPGGIRGELGALQLLVPGPCGVVELRKGFVGDSRHSGSGSLVHGDFMGFSNGQYGTFYVL